jgi:hypothetical protein
MRIVTLLALIAGGVALGLWFCTDTKVSRRFYGARRARHANIGLVYLSAFAAFLPSAPVNHIGERLNSGRLRMGGRHIARRGLWTECLQFVTCSPAEPLTTDRQIYKVREAW